MAFSTIIGNTDDHLRNHGFLLTERGWRLSPMFDVNPNPHGGVSALDTGDLFDDSEYYRLTKKEAKQRYDEMYSLIKDLAPNFVK
ncbi:MAG: HipA domain-containing protein, partial [Kiritimatiellae bacterium]|nr:HipA domain-containing protein [Kiritimatiellia bacterium]MBR3776815.1 HipA domain-containing protein [Kiritimatiellia bacterium]